MQRRGLWGPGPAEGLEAGSARRSPSGRSGCRSNSLFRLSKYTTSSLAYLRPPHPPSGPETLEGTRLEERKPTRPAMDRVHTATPTSRPAHLLRAPLRSRAAQAVLAHLPGRPRAHGSPRRQKWRLGAGGTHARDLGGCRTGPAVSRRGAGQSLPGPRRHSCRSRASCKTDPGGPGASSPDCGSTSPGAAGGDGY